MSPQNRIEELEEIVRLLQLENDRLSEQAEDNLLLGLIGERIGRATDRESLLETVLEQVSLLKDIPFCACCATEESGLRIEASYASFTHEGVSGRLLAVPAELLRGAQSEEVELSAADCLSIGLGELIPPSSFEASTALLVKARTRFSMPLLFLFVDGRPHRHLPAMQKILSRAVDMAASHLDTFALMRTLTDLNETLDRKVEERTRELQDSEERYRLLIENQRDLVVQLEVDGSIQFASPSFCRAFARTQEELRGTSLSTLVSEDDRELLLEALSGLSGPPHTCDFEVRIPASQGERWINWTCTALLDAAGKVLACQGIGRDVTDKKVAEKERQKLEEQYRHSQKMEAIGRLAGGVAHDFNNLLTAILGYCDLLAAKLEPDSSAARDAAEIKAAGDRAASLTGQLLAFSRKQVRRPRILRLSDELASAEKMMARLLGEDIDLSIRLSPDAGCISADPGQIQQIILNLAVNARDAMPDGGKLEIQTENVDCDQAYALAHHAPQPGPYVVLTVADSGCGMDAETRSHLFEPFFTTKQPGKGTGLGLATVHAIVAQSGGEIWVYSEPGQGTVFKIYFPRVLGKGETGEIADGRPRTARGTETILVVEDSEEVRGLVLRVLESEGYRVLVASSSAEALVVAREEKEAIHLLLTDVVIPGINGRALAERLVLTRPKIKVLYMSGYTANLIAHHGVLDEGLHFIQKPLGPEALARKVRDVLGEI
jgi:PAS domain S-box-containing protein